MRFDAKFGASDGWDDEVGELELPPGLAELGEQLQADSLHLAQLYPPVDDPESIRKCLPRLPEDEAPAGSRWTKAAASLGSGIAIALLASLVAAVAIGWPTSERTSRKSESQPVKSKVTVPDQDSLGRAAANEVVVTRPRQSDDSFEDYGEPVSTPSYVVPRPSVITPVSAHEASMLNASGPQAEAYLDYIEMTSVHNVKLSF